MFFTRISISQPVFATMMMLAIVLVGLFAYPRIPIEQLPDVDFPVVAITVSYPGAAPEAIETDILEPLEEAITTIAGIDTIDATARTGSATVIITFDLSVDSQIASQDVREKVAQISGALPEDAADPVVLRFDPNSEPIMSLALTSPQDSTQELSQLANDVIIPRLLSIQGVGSVSAIGDADRQLSIDVDPNALLALNMTPQDVINAVRATHQNVSSGSLENLQNAQSVQVQGRLDTLQDFENILIADRDGRAVRVSDVATVTDGQSRAQSIALLNGQPSISLDVVKNQGSNTVAIAQDIRAAVAELSQETLPERMELVVVQDNATDIENSLHALEAMLLEGAFLATLIVFLFLNSWRSTIITGLTLPISIIGTMTAIYFLGYTLNIMTMMALTLAIGMLIDDAIVVRENIMRHLAMGKSHAQAALDGTQEIGLAVIATTLTIVAVFLPVAFMDGIIGRFFLQFGVTISIAVLISLFVAFTLDPMLSSVWYDPSADPKTKKGPVWKAVNGFDVYFEKITNGYATLLATSLRFRKTTLAIAVASFAASFFVLPLVGTEFLPASDSTQARVRLTTPPGSSLAYTRSKAEQAETLLRAHPDVVQTYTTVSGGLRASGSTSASITLQLSPIEDRDQTANELNATWRKILQQVPGATFRVSSASGPGGGGGAPVSVTVSGPASNRVETLADDVTRRLTAVPGLVEVETNRGDTEPLSNINVDLLAAQQRGLSQDTIGAALRAFLEGQSVGDWTNDLGDSYTIFVQGPPSIRQSQDALETLPVGQGDDIAITLREVATISQDTGPSEIRRQNTQRSLSVSAQLNNVALGDVSPLIAQALNDMDVPAGYTVSQGGEQQDLEESGASAASALVLAIVFIYLILASQFGSFIQPLAIMASLPLALIGVLLGLLIGGSTLNMYSIIGFIMLMGLVVKNAILLVDNANQHTREGQSLKDALITAGRTRFRPIVMTTIAMICGMIPMAINLSGGSGENAPMAHAVIGGLISSSLLTLVVVPVALTYLDSFAKKTRSFFPKAPDTHTS